MAQGAGHLHAALRRHYTIANDLSIVTCGTMDVVSHGTIGLTLQSTQAQIACQLLPQLIQHGLMKPDQNVRTKAGCGGC